MRARVLGHDLQFSSLKLHLPLAATLLERGTLEADEVDSLAE